MHKVQDDVVLDNNAVRLAINVGGGILLTHGEHLHDRIISLRGETWSYRLNLTQPLFIEVSVSG